VQLGLIPAFADRKHEQDDPGTILDQLLRYSQAIRRSGALRGLAKSSDYVEYDEYDTGLNLTAKFRDMTDEYLRMRLPRIQNALHERLLDTVCIRQQSFAFQRSRQRKETDPDEVASVDILPAKSTIAPRTGSAYSQRKSITKPIPPVSKPSQARMQRQRLGPPQSATTFRSTASHMAHEEREAFDTTFMLEHLPLRPRILSGVLYDQCPYCFMRCPVTDFSESNWSYVNISNHKHAFYLTH
jgi:hypothetical protein